MPGNFPYQLDRLRLATGMRQPPSGDGRQTDRKHAAVRFRPTPINLYVGAAKWSRE